MAAEPADAAAPQAAAAAPASTAPTPRPRGAPRTAARATAASAGRPPRTLQGYVLHQYDWSESSLILELWTRERGRLAAVARGVKRPSSQLRGVLMPFQRLQLTLGRESAEAASEIKNLRGAEWAGEPPLAPRGALFEAFYLNELLLKLLQREDPHPRLFDAYAQALAVLRSDSALKTAPAALRAFELLMLQDSGVLGALDRVTQTQAALAPTRHYTLRPELGVVPTAQQGLTGAHLAAVAAALDAGADVFGLAALCAEDAAAWQRALKPLFAYHLGRSTLRTRQVLQGVRRYWAPAGSTASGARDAAEADGLETLEE